jgi:hypothetical protein
MSLYVIRLVKILIETKIILACLLFHNPHESLQQIKNGFGTVHLNDHLACLYTFNTTQCYTVSA